MKLVGDKFFGGSTDIWTGKRKRMFISFTIHVVDGASLRTLDLACQPFDVTHSGENIAKELKAILGKKGLDPMKCTGITTDNASNMLNAGRILDRAPDQKIFTQSCFCHSLQLAVYRFQGVDKVKGRANTAAAPAPASGPAPVGAGGSGGGTPGGAGAGGGNGAAGDGTPGGPETSRVRCTPNLVNSIVAEFSKSPKVRGAGLASITFIVLQFWGVGGAFFFCLAHILFVG